MNKQLSLRPFGVKDKVGYMFGNVANDLTFIMASMFLTVFYTDVLHINAALVGGERERLARRLYVLRQPYIKPLCNRQTCRLKICTVIGRFLCRSHCL